MMFDFDPIFTPITAPGTAAALTIATPEDEVQAQALKREAAGVA